MYLQLCDLHVHGDGVFPSFSVKLLVFTCRNHILMTWCCMCLSSSVQVHDYIIERKPCRYLVVKSFAAAQDTIYKALEASHLHYENIFKDVVRNLTSNTSAPSAPTSQALHLPTLLTSRAAATERKDQDDTD